MKTISEIKITKVETQTTEIHKDLFFVKVITNDREVETSIQYKGDFFEYNVEVLYNPDLELLKKWNPYWGEHEGNKDYSWFKTIIPETPEEIDINKIVYGYKYNHTFYDINLEGIPVVINGDYIEARLSNEVYKLEELKEYFDQHPNVVKCSEILSIPYYNASEERNKYLQVLILPNKEWLSDNTKRCLFDENGADYLGLKNFLK